MKKQIQYSAPAVCNAVSAFRTYHGIRHSRYNCPIPRGEPLASKGFNRFLALGALCAERKWPVDDYVAFFLSSCRKNHGYITPKDMLEDTVVAKYAAKLAMSDGSTYRQLWGTCEQKLRDAVRLRFHSAEAALRNLDLSFPSWFRVLFPWPANEMLYLEFGDSALLELQSDILLRKFLAQSCACQFEEFQRRFGRFPEYIQTGEIK